jgi:CubicO group peptidase (beta-lactamase class C family)
MRIFLSALLILSSTFISSEELIQKNPLEGLETYIEKTKKDWQVPGLAIAIVKNDQIIFVKGFGNANVEKNLPITSKTLFAIGSITKSFTTYIMGKLVDDNKLNLDSPVVNYLPSFLPYV